MDETDGFLKSAALGSTDVFSNRRLGWATGGLILVLLFHRGSVRLLWTAGVRPKTAALRSTDAFSNSCLGWSAGGFILALLFHRGSFRLLWTAGVWSKVGTGLEVGLLLVTLL